MDLTRTHAGFTQTSYTLIGALSDERTRRAAAEELTRVYWPPVYSYLRKSGHDREQAAELTQAFFVEKIIEGQLIDRFDANRGRLRSLMLKGIQNFAVDAARKIRSADRAAVQRFTLAPEQENWGENTTPTIAFDRRWAISQLNESLQRCEKYFLDAGRENHWKAFEDRVLKPAIYGSEPTPMEQLASDLEFRNAALVAAAVQLVKRRQIIFLREVISDSVSSPDQVESELNDAIWILKSG